MSNILKKISDKIKGFVLWNHPFKSPVVLFTSFEGQYNDNPKAIAKCLHETAPEIRIVWAVSEKSHELLPDYITPVEYNSTKYKEYSYRAQILIDNVIGYRWKGLKKGRFFPRWLLANKRQLNISTWHGTPIKQIGRDAYPLNQYYSFVSSADYLISGCRYTYDRLVNAFNGINVKCIGTPRNDVLVKMNSAEETIKIKEYLSFPLDKKILLYAPTFRNTTEESGLTQLKLLDFDSIFKSLEKRFGGEWVFVFRVHHSVLKQIDVEELKKKSGNRIINGNLHDDMADYLAVTDVLLTDYSGSVFDFSLTNKPCFLFTPDIEKYESERGTYISIKDLPYDSARTSDELCSLIRDYNEEELIIKLKEFNERVGNVEDGHASEKVVKAMIQFLKTKEKENLL